MDARPASNPHPQALLTTNPMCTTAFELPGYRIVRSLGVVRGIVVRSRSVVGNFAAGIQSLFGGNITILTSLCEHARGEAFDLMIQHANQVGANAVIAVRYDANEIMTGASEVLAYGTAVVVEPLE
ncbi:MAG: YbjQ family protein [Pirellulales bacterium]